VQAVARRAAGGRRSFREELLGDDEIREALSEEEIDAALDPSGYLGSAGTFVDRALALYGKEGLV